MSATGRVMRVLAAVAPAVLIATLLAVAAAALTGFPWWPAAVLAVLLAVLVLPVVVYLQVLKRNERFYRSEIARGLTRALDSERVLKDTFELREDKLIVFSDLHKGTRDPADDFWRSERAYVAALAYYLETGHRLVVLGDVEELWENRARDVMPEYNDVFVLERQFHAAGRYVRVWGNHDDDWRRDGDARKYLFPALDAEVQRWEAVKLTVTDGGDELGTLFLAHGHQGTADSQILASVSRPGVMIFGFLQRRFKRPWNTPAVDASLREPHDMAMFEWAKTAPSALNLVLIAGHTHRPVFWRSRPHVPSDEDIAEHERKLEQERAERAAPEVLGRTRARLEYAKAQRRTGVKAPTAVDPPCYFNTGCCAFADGDVSGIEISGGRIRLVRWPDDAGEPAHKELDSEPLETILAVVREHPGALGPA